MCCRAPVSPYAASKPPLAATSSVAIPRQQSMGGSAFCAAPVNMLARSCPRPINMQPRRQPSFQGEGDDLAGFVPPHELVACSLMDTSNVTVSAGKLMQRSTARRR